MSWFRTLPLVLLVCLGAAPRLAAAERPNILFIYTDDQAAWALGASGNEQAITPHMDRLAREGAYLKNAFTTTPVCSPSRASLLFSRYGSEQQITDWIHPRESRGVNPQWTTFPECLAAAGYATGLIGKWHLGHKQPEHHPTQHGYQSFVGFLDGGTSSKNPVLEKHGEPQKYTGLTADILGDEAIALIKAHKEGPFFLSLHHRAPHRPWLPVADEDWEPYKNLDPKIPNPDYPGLLVEKVKRSMREYLASVRSVDRNLGRILEVLDEEELADNTVVILTSDHGYNMGHHGIWHKGNGHWIVENPPAAQKNIPRGQRPNMYDRSLRAPALVRWPGKIAAGTVIDETISNLDWYPTLVAIGQGMLPEDETIRGHNFLPLLRGESIDDWDNDLYAEYSTKHQSRTHMRAYRTPQWKLVRDFLNEGRDALYDLQNDPAETTNLIDDPRPEVQQVVEQLHARILENMRKVDDPVLRMVSGRKGSE